MDHDFVLYCAKTIAPAVVKAQTVRKLPNFYSSVCHDFSERRRLRDSLFPPHQLTQEEEKRFARRLSNYKIYKIGRLEKHLHHMT
jgi:hypothetical protein